MTAFLPRSPNLEHLKKSAKQLLAAHRRGEATCLPFLRRMSRFAEASDEEILSARVTLQETQHLVAQHFGFRSWEKLRGAVLAGRTMSACSIDDVRRAEPDLPPYAGAGLPLGLVAALHHAGEELSFSAFVAISGWAFAFGYAYEDLHPAYLSVGGDPRSDSPYSAFSFGTDLLGFGFESVPTDEPDRLWKFVVTHVDAGTPIVSEHLDGGLINGYQEHDGHRKLHFDGTVGSGWIDVGGLQPVAVHTLVRRREPPPRAEFVRSALARALHAGSAHVWRGVPQGLAALEAYLNDVSDAGKEFAATPEWFCWATFERLMARWCAARWLRSVAGEAGSLRDAAAHYGEAFALYDRYRNEVASEDPSPTGFQERVRTPARIAVITSLLREAIEAERRGLEALARVTK